MCKIASNFECSTQTKQVPTLKPLGKSDHERTLISFARAEFAAEFQSPA